MSDNINDGGPAFPVTTDSIHSNGTYLGATLRDYFAGQAMEAFMSSKIELGSLGQSAKNWYEKNAEHAYLFADAMIKAREVK